MAKGLELTSKGLAVLLTVAACSGESSGQSSETAASRAAIMGTVVHTEDRNRNLVGVRGYLDPHDSAKVENGWYPEGARVSFLCLEIGRLGVDADVPGPDPVQWSVWYQVNGGNDGKPQWLPQPFVQTETALPYC